MPTSTDETIPTRELILRAASQLFAERGYYGTSTRDIAQAVGIRQPSLFHHFGSKTEMMRELQNREFTPAVCIWEAAQVAAGRPAARLWAAVDVDVRRLLSSSFVLTGTTGAAVLNDPEFAEGAEAYARIQSLQESLVREGVDVGEFIEIEPAIANRAIEWTIEGVLVDRTRHPELEASELATVLAAFVVRSLLSNTAELGHVRDEARALIAAFTEPT